jgi:hypothetical protein
MIFASALLATRALLSPTKKRTLFSRLPLSEPTIRWFWFCLSRFQNSRISCFCALYRSENSRTSCSCDIVWEMMFSRMTNRKKNEECWEMTFWTKMNCFFWAEDERETRRKKFLIISRIKKISQRHETNEKQDEIIFRWARSERRIWFFCEKKESRFFSEEEKKSK